MGSGSSSRIVDHVHAGTDRVLIAMAHQSQGFVKLFEQNNKLLQDSLNAHTTLLQDSLNAYTTLLQAQIGALSGTVMMAAFVIFGGLVLWTMVYWHTNRIDTKMLCIEATFEIQVNGRKTRSHIIAKGPAKHVQGYLGVVGAQTQALMFEAVQPSVRHGQQVQYRRPRQLNEWIAT